MSETHLHYLVLSDNSSLEPQLDGIFELTAENKADSAALYRLKQSYADAIVPVENLLVQLGYTRIFEKYWLPREASNLQRRTLVQALFSFIAISYDSIITRDLNLQCYEHIYDLAVGRLQEVPARVLDFGCGTGLVTESSFSHKIPHLRGFDFCPKMASIAKEKGLHTMDTDIGTLHGTETFDVVLASYVFHYGMSSNEWRSLLACITDRGGLFGNFHKGIGLKQALKAIESLDANYGYEVTESKYGPVLAVIISP